MNINNSAVLHFNLKVGDTITILQDDEDELNWYISFGDKSGFKLRTSQNKRNELILNCASLAKKLFECLGDFSTSLRLRISTDEKKQDGIACFPLLKLPKVNATKKEQVLEQ